MNVSGGKKLKKNTIMKQIELTDENEMTEKAHHDFCLFPAGKGVGRFWLPLFPEPPMSVLFDLWS